MKLVRISAAVLLAITTLATSLAAGDWPWFRGPFSNGSTDETGLPTEWSTTQNVTWSADLPGPSAATPIVSGDHVFVASTDTDEDALVAIALDRKTGKQLWKRVVSKGVQRDGRSNYASSTPASDGNRVVFFFGNGAMETFDFEGKSLWKRDIADDYGDFAFLWTFATSPVLFDGKLYLQVLQRDTAVEGRGFRDRKNDSYILALDPATGKELWKHVRPSQARAESLEAFTTPVPFEESGRKALLVAGGDVLTAHDASNGEEIWRWGTWNPERIGHWRLVPSPVAGNDIVLVCAPKRDPIYAIKAGGKGVLSDDAIAWVSRDERNVSSDVPTPAFHDGDFFILSDVRKVLCRVEPKTGNVKWVTRLPGDPKYESSPLVADGKVYQVNFQGDVVIVDARTGELINTIAMKATPEYPIRSSIVAAHGKLFIRMNRKLYCVGK